MIQKTLFLDIETVPQFKTFSELPDNGKELYLKKMKAKPGDDPEELYQKAGVFSEFSKVVCVSLGYIWLDQGEYRFKSKSYYGDDEKTLLRALYEVLEVGMWNTWSIIVAHNGKSFDYPFLSRRYLANKLDLPKCFNVAGKKPWEILHLKDTMVDWQFGDYRYYTSLELLCYTFGVPTPKDAIGGADVAQVYYNGGLDKIVAYCEKDILALARVWLRINNLDNQI